MSFSAIRDQDKAKAVLKGCLRQGRAAGGYLFTGPEGVGRLAAAKEFAKALNCEAVNVAAQLCEAAGSEPCDACLSCKKIDAGIHPDIHLIDSQESEIKIEDIRQLQKEMSLRPFEGKFKFFIIDNAHNLNAASSNALLKVLEEPSKNSILVLITDKPSKLFGTVVSRCKTVKFFPLKRDGLRRVLIEDHKLDNDQAHFLAYFSEGRAGRALELKGTDMLKKKNAIIDRFNAAQRPNLENFTFKEKEDLRLCLNILAAWFRDIYLAKIGANQSEMINLDRKLELLAAAGRYSFADLTEIFSCVSDSLRYLDQNINTKLLLYNLGAHLWKE